MSEYIKKLFAMLVAAILAHANRLARLAAIQHEMDAYAAAYEEAKSLEAKGHPQLARFVRSQIDETLGGALAAEGAPAVNGDGHPPFGLPRPDSDLSRPEGQGSPRRRGRRPSNGAKPQLESPQEIPATADPMSPPTTTPDQHP